jgi:hypothetical protein
MLADEQQLEIQEKYLGLLAVCRWRFVSIKETVSQDCRLIRPLLVFALVALIVLRKD